MKINITFHGVEHGQYWQGHGLQPGYDNCATGIGDCNLDAMTDALEQLEGEISDPEIDAHLKEKFGKSLEELVQSQDKEAGMLHSECEAEDDECELHYFVSVSYTP